MADPTLKPFTGTLDALQEKPSALAPFEGKLDGESSSRSLTDHARDVAATAVKGAIGVPEAAVGIADLVTGGQVGKALENEDGPVGLRFKQAKEVANDWHSDATKEAQRKFQAADGIVDKAITAVQNPSTIGVAVGESIPGMVAGGAVGRGLMAATRLGQMGATGAAMAGAAGEGVMAAGSAAEQIRQETPDGLLTPTQAGLAGATGVATAGFGVLGGRVANKLGIGDAETMLAQGTKGMAKQNADDAARAAMNPFVQQQAAKGIPRRVIEGAIAEGFLEELPQSVAEQVFQNLALGKDWHTDVDSAAVMGVLSGGAMGGGAAGFHGLKQPKVSEQDVQRNREEVDQAAARAQQEESAGLRRVREAFAQQLAQASDTPPVLDEQAMADAGVTPAPPRPVLDTARVDSMLGDPSPSPEAVRPAAAPAEAQVDPARAQLEQAAASGGALSSAALTAIDSGASDAMQQAAAAAAAAQAEAEQKGGKKPTTATQKAEQQPQARQALDRETGEILEPTSVQTWTDQQLSQTFRGAQSREVRLQLAQELSRRRAAREQQELQAELDAEQRGTVLGADGADAAFANTTEDAGPVPAELSLPTTQGVTDGSQAAQAQQDRAQPPQVPAAPADARPAPTAAGSAGARGAAPAPGVADGSTTPPNAGAKAAPATGAQAAAEFTTVQTAAGRSYTVRTADLSGTSEKLSTFTAQGKPSAVRVPRAAIAPSQAAEVQQVAAIEKTAQAAIKSAANSPAQDAVSAAASEAAMSPTNDLPEPTQAQREAGNYRKGHARVNGLDISIENPAGTHRRPEWPALKNHYGYIKGTVGRDKDHVDVFLTDRASDATLPVFVVDQNNRDGSFDEHKVIMGAADETQARAAYLDNYSPGWTGLGGITQMTQDEFKSWVRDPAKTKERAATPAAAAPQAATPAVPAQRKPRGILAKKAAAEEQARAAHFVPGNIVKSYGGHDRVVSYQPADENGRWSVTVREVRQEDGRWVDVPGMDERIHATQPDARELKAGPVARAAAQPEVAPDAQQAAAPAAALQPLLERHNAVERGISEGTLELEQYQQTFAALVQDEAATKAEINKLTKDDLLRTGGPNFAYRYKNDKKELIVNAGYNSMLDTYALGRKYGSNSFVMSAGGLRAHQEAQDKALRELVANTTQEDLAARAAEIKAARDEFKARREAAASALENPKTLEDFRGFMRHWIESGETTDVAFLRLTPEQRQAFDVLEAESSREARERAKADSRKANVRRAGDTTAGEIIATKHTKHGHDLFVIQLADRVSREDYETLNTSARRMGGNYSSFRGNGAIPGFQFRTRESAEAFQQLVAGDAAAAQTVAKARRDAFEDDKSQTAVERLRTMADAIDARADAQLSADRKTNTARRARMASAAEEAARGNKAYAGTMRNLAEAIEAGKAPFLDGVRTKTQLSQLQQAIGAAKAKQLLAKHGSWAAAEQHKHEPADTQTVDFAEFPRFGMYRSDLAGLARQLLDIDGGKKLGAALERVADDVTDAYTEWAKANLSQVSQFGRAGQMAEFSNKADAERAIKRSGLVGKAVVLAVKRGQNRVVLSPGEAMQRGLWKGDGDKRINLSMDFVQDLVKLGKRRGSSALTIPWQLESTLEKRQRLLRMGIQTPAEYRSALRELVSLRENAQAPDRIKELERDMVGRQNDGLDFFPTASAVTENAVDAADIQEGMDVLEPSAGMGHIADHIREQTGVEPDVVELSGKRRELLEAKGYNLVGADFLELEGKQYDRIVMNPPFSDGRDIQHVRHAYSLLKPGGRVVAIMSESAFFQSNKRAEAFRDWLDTLGATNEKLPDGSFMNASLPVNTGVSARMVVIEKPEGTVERPPRDDSSTTDGDGEPAFRRDADPAAFDTAGFLATMARSPFSEAARAQAVQSVQATVDAARAAWGPKAPQVVVAFDMQDPRVPEAARAADLRQRSGGARGAPEGFYYRGKAYLMASRLNTPADASRVLFHEVLGHHGLRGKFGRDLDKVLNQVAIMRKAEVAAKMQEYGLRGVNSLSVREAAEEVLAEMAEKNPRLHFVQSAIAAIRNFLRANVPGFRNMRLTDNDIIQAYILPAREFVTRKGDAQGPTIARAPVPSFSRTESTQATYESRIDALFAGGKAQAGTRILDSSDVMGLLGYPKVPLMLNESHLRDGLTNHPEMTAAAWKKVPGWIENPAAVYSDPRHPTRLTLIAPEPLAGYPVVMVIESRPNPAGSKPLPVEPTESLLVTVYAKTAGGLPAPGYLASSGHLKYVDTKNAPEIWQRGGGQFPKQAALSQGRQKILTEKQLGGYRRAQEQKSAPESQPRAGGQFPRQAADSQVREEILAGKQPVGTREEAGNSPDGEGEPPLFSRSKLQDIKASALEQLHQTLRHEGKVSLWDKTVGTMRHLGERSPAFKPVYEAAQRFIDDVSMLGNDAADMAPRLLPRVETLADLKKKPITAADNKAVARPVFEGTLMWARDVDGTPIQVDDLTKKYANLPAAEKAQILLRAGRIDPEVLRMWQGLPLAQYEAAVNSRFESKALKPGVVWTADELAKMFGLNAGQVSLYQEARSAIDRSIDMTARADMLRALGADYAGMRDLVLQQENLSDAMKVLTDTLQADARENPDRAERLLGLNNAVVKSFERAKELQDFGYAPLSRFGRYTVDLVDAAGERQYFGMFESMREANQMRMRMASTFPGATVTSGTMSQEAFKLFQGITPESLEQFGSMLGLSNTGDEAKDKAFQAYLQLAKNNHSALKRLIHRKGIAGYSEDVGRVLASFVYSNARLGAGGLNAGTLEAAIEGIPKEQGELRDVAMGLRSYIQDPQEEGQAVRGMLFAQYLGGSVASALVNMTQPFQITMPWLSQYGGMRRAGAQLAAAVRDMARGGKYEADLAQALQAAEDDGVVSPQEIHQLMAQARGTGSLRTGDGTRAGDARAAVSNNWERVKVAWGQPFALAEQFNRRSTFIAAYRLAKEQGMDAPGEFARRAVVETQFVYSKANKPRWARGAIGGTLFTFKTYSVSYLELMQRMWTQGGPEGKRAVGWALAMLMLMGGAGGLPFVEDLEDLIDGVGQLMGYNVSSKQWRKQVLREYVGKELGEFVEQGVSGLPGAPIDISGRLGMGNLLPGTGLLLTKQSRERDLLEVAGPAGDLIARGFTGARKALTGDIGGAALEVSPAAVRNAFKGADMATSGIYKDSKGYKVIDTTLDEAIAKAIGFQPHSVAQVQESNSFMQRSKAFYTQTSSDIKAQWAQALFEKDDAALARVRERLADWNRDNPEQPITVDMRTVWKRVREMGKDRTQRIEETAPKALRGQMREMARENG